MSFASIIRRLSALVLLALIMLNPLAVAQAQAPGVPPVSAAPPPPTTVLPATPAPVTLAPGAAGAALSLTDGYVLGVGDVVEVVLVGRADFQARVQIQTDGRIQLPLIGEVQAADRTVLQLRDDVRNALVSGGYYASPAVAIAVATYASRYVTVLGEVVTPGLVPVDRAYRVSEILARVGGTRPTGADEVVIRRESGEEITLNIRDVATGGDAQDPIVNPGDKLFVAAAPQFFIYGQVNAPGSYRVDRGMSLRMALARGGGLTAMGSERRVRIFRNGEELRSFDPSGLIAGGDVIVVGERFF